jgi:hypothetical protein
MQKFRILLQHYIQILKADLLILILQLLISTLEYVFSVMLPCFFICTNYVSGICDIADVL